MFAIVAMHVSTFCRLTCFPCIASSVLLVSWATKKELIDTVGSSVQREHGVEFQGEYYFPAGPEEAALFRADPLRYLSNQQFPGEHDLPHRVFPADLPSCNLKLALQGYCPVALLESAVRIPRVWDRLWPAAWCVV